MYDELFTYVQSIIIIDITTGRDEEYQLCQQKGLPFYIMWRGPSDGYLTTQKTKYATAEDAFRTFVDNFVMRNKITQEIKVLAHTGDVFLKPNKIKAILDDMDIEHTLETF